MNQAPQKISRAITKTNCAAFTLLEVMIAISIIAIAFVSLLGLQARSLAQATEARFMLESSLLSAEKLAEFDSGERALVSDNGIFDESNTGYSWDAKIDELILENEEIPSLASPLKMVRLELSISLENTLYKHTIVCYYNAPHGETE